MTIKIGYKVLTSKQRKSIVRVSSFGGRIYGLNKKTIPMQGYGPLCIFDSYLTAINFVQAFMLSHYIIVKCHYEKSSITILHDFGYDINVILPLGTILADSVTCLE